MVNNDYIPDRGDIVWIDFGPQIGHEQKGNRPAIVLSHKRYNKISKLGLFCPITSHKKNYPFEVTIINGKVRGVALTDQIKNFDWSKRKLAYITKATEAEMLAVIEKINILIGD